MPYFQAFSAFSVTATNFMNSITFVMNHLISYFDIFICHCSNRTLCYHLFKFHGFNHGYFLGGYCYIHLTMGTQPSSHDIHLTKMALESQGRNAWNFLFGVGRLEKMLPSKDHRPHAGTKAEKIPRSGIGVNAARWQFFFSC